MGVWDKEIPLSKLAREHGTTSGRKEVRWIPMDSEDRFRHTVKEHIKKGIPFPWKEDSFTYSLNEFGYRGHHPLVSAQKKILVCGCSFTFGIGLPYEQVWPQIVEDNIAYSKVINLALGGESCDYVTRIIYKTIDLIKPDAVMVLWPPAYRYELSLGSSVQSVLPQDNAFSVFFSSDQVVHYHFEKNRLFLQEICGNKGIPLYEEAFDDLTFPITTRARDNAHPGKEWQRQVADLFLNKYYKR